MSTGRLTTTSYAILGLLAVQPWSSYELTRQMDRGLGRFWPRAASKLYEEPKKLVAHGLAIATPAASRGRRRTVYMITPMGRTRLAEWTTSSAADPVLESEQLLRVFFAEAGAKADLLRIITDMARWADEQRRTNAGIARTYVVGDAAFPERLAHTMLVGRFLADFEDMVAAWSRWAEALIESWPEDVAEAEADLATLRVLAAR